MSKSAVPAALQLAGLSGGGHVHAGPIISAVKGRHDQHPLDVDNEAFVLPSDIVSALGEGNTLAGIKVIEDKFGKSSPHRASGGVVPIIAAGGEIVLSPEQVARAGGGDLKKGHEFLRKYVLDVRKRHIKTLRKLAPPHK